MTYPAVEIVRRIEEALAGRPRLSLALFCREMNLSRHLAARAIKDTKGMSFRDLQQELLLKKAKEMLSQPGAKVQDVALALGYRRAEDFGRFVRRKTSRKASELRKEAHLVG
ncbi:MAG: helix-turn-helix domain-containing protein [Acidobacteriota bacterium]